MSMFDGRHDERRFQDRSNGSADERAAGGTMVAVYGCSRIGMQANPPRSTFSDWLRRR